MYLEWWPGKGCAQSLNIQHHFHRKSAWLLYRQGNWCVERLGDLFLATDRIRTKCQATCSLIIQALRITQWYFKFLISPGVNQNKQSVVNLRKKWKILFKPNPGDSLSESSENSSEEMKGEASTYVILAKGMCSQELILEDFTIFEKQIP